MIPLEFLQPQNERLKRIAKSLDLEAIKELFSDWMTLQKWGDMKALFEVWITCYDKNGKLNKPDLDLFNHSLRANLMMKAKPADMVQLIEDIQGIGMKVNTASYNLVLKAMHQEGDIIGAVNLLDWYAFLCFLCVSWCVF